MSSDDVKEVIDEAHLSEAGERMAEADEDRSHYDNLPYWLWLIFVYGSIVVVVAGAVVFGVVEIGTFVIKASEIDVSDPLQTAITGLVYLLLAGTAIVMLVVLPGEYLSALSGAAEGALGDDEE